MTQIREPLFEGFQQGSRIEKRLDDFESLFSAGISMPDQWLNQNEVARLQTHLAASRVHHAASAQNEGEFMKGQPMGNHLMHAETAALDSDWITMQAV